MNKYVKKGTTQEIDRLLIPYKIYDLTISRDTEELKKFFIKDTTLAVKFVGFYSRSLFTNSLAFKK